MVQAFRQEMHEPVRAAGGCREGGGAQEGRKRKQNFLLAKCTWDTCLSEGMLPLAHTMQYVEKMTLFWTTLNRFILIFGAYFGP